MLSEHIEDALGGGADVVPALEEIARTVWRAVEAGSLGWEEAGGVWTVLVRARRAALGGGGGAPCARSGSCPGRCGVRTGRAAPIARRR